MSKNKIRPLFLAKKKKRLLQQFKKKLKKEAKQKARENPHSKRSLRWCGLTIHITENCPYSCQYCYIKDLGFEFDSGTPSPLSGKELVFSLLNNPAFFPGKGGTLLAIGAVSEPFLFPRKMMNYLRELSRLGNPLQFSTKAYLSPELARKIKRIIRNHKSKISPLVTIVTLSYASELEKNAPSPSKRFKTIQNLAEAGLQPVLFLRPIIPGVNVKEAEILMKRAKKAGAVGVVFGSFRVTRRIVHRLEEQGVPTFEIKRRVKQIDEKQRPVPLFEREKLMTQARGIGLVPWRSTCCANSFQSGVTCPSACFLDEFCTDCPNQCSFPEDVPSKEEVEKTLNYLRIKGRVEKEVVFLRTKAVSEMIIRNLARRKVKITGRRIT